LHKIFPTTIVVDPFDTAITAKSFISGMDVFTGARMHATIAAYSSGVPVIPFSYSRKFEGLYDFIKYPYVISGKSIETEMAIKKTIEYIEEYDLLRKSINDYKPQIDSILFELKKSINDMIKAVKEK